MNHKTLFGLAAIIAASGFFIRSIQPAHARFGPTVSEGAHPYLSFTGQISNGSTHDLLNVPGGKLFVVTSAMSNDYYCDIYQDSTLLVEGHSRATYSGIFTNGKGNLKISGGSALKVVASGGYCNYYIEGYYAHPG